MITIFSLVGDSVLIIFLEQAAVLSIKGCIHQWKLQLLYAILEADLLEVINWRSNPLEAVEVFFFFFN
jgi:hypothetical protein